MNILTFRDCQIAQRTDGFVNLTQMAKANDARLDVYLKTKETKAYLKAAQESIYHQTVVNGEVVLVAGFGRNKQTWGHPLVALHLAQWISPEFHLWCNRHIKTLIETGETKSTSYDVSNTVTEPLTIAEALVKMANGMLAQERRLTGAEGTIEVVKEKVEVVEEKIETVEDNLSEVTLRLDIMSKSLPWTGREMRVAIANCLDNPEQATLSNIRIGKICYCSEAMVRKVKGEILKKSQGEPQQQPSKKSSKKSTRIQLSIDLEMGGD